MTTQAKRTSSRLKKGEVPDFMAKKRSEAEEKNGRENMVLEEELVYGIGTKEFQKELKEEH